MKAYLQLMRPANIVTAMADILAGFAISGAAAILLQTNFGAATFVRLALLLLATIGLYGGGVVFNDVFDVKLDAVERPERPIPSGRATVQQAALLGGVLLLAGIAFASAVSVTSGIIAASIAAFALIYDKYGKHTVFGPINMGMCRGGNLLLGVSVAASPILLVNSMNESIQTWRSGTSMYDVWYIALIPVVYIAAITVISRGEVHGGSKWALYAAAGLYSIVILVIAALGLLRPVYAGQNLLFLALFAYLIFPPLFQALRNRQPRTIGLAVKAGVIALIVMDAAIAATFAGWIFGVVVLGLLPVSRYLAQRFAVT